MITFVKWEFCAFGLWRGEEGGTLFDTKFKTSVQTHEHERKVFGTIGLVGDAKMLRLF
jgi:hypothetical protein